MRRYQLYIDGKFVDSQSGETFTSINPATAPFGGYKQSGVGREFGWLGPSEYLQTKHVHVDSVDDLGKKFWYQSLFRQGG